MRDLLQTNTAELSPSATAGFILGFVGECERSTYDLHLMGNALEAEHARASLNSQPSWCARSLLAATSPSSSTCPSRLLLSQSWAS